MRLKRTNNFLKAIALASGMLFFSVHALADYKALIENTFWGGIYKEGGETFFCKKAFSKKTALLSVSHIYPNVQVRDHLQCGTKRRCLRSNERYLEIISDLHNIVPSDSYFEFKRKSARFGELDESIEANECGIRKKLHIIEPPDELKGDVARILLYMRANYDLPLEVHISLLKLWHENDPPSAEEIARNELIAQFQGNENEFVSNPSLVHNED
jgi:deoxyribonuclease-1